MVRENIQSIQEEREAAEREGRRKSRRRKRRRKRRKEEKKEKKKKNKETKKEQNEQENEGEQEGEREEGERTERGRRRNKRSKIQQESEFGSTMQHFVGLKTNIVLHREHMLGYVSSVTNRESLKRTHFLELFALLSSANPP